MNLVTGDCRERMRDVPDASIAAIVTDPPYEIEFMGRKWDSTGVAFDVATWAEAMRVLKPGGHVVAFGLPRTAHRLACAVEDAGFEVRDCLHWVYGTGFPKSLNISKHLAKSDPESAGRWQGWGTGLKPAQESIYLFRKPCEGTAVGNVVAHGTGAINVGACMVDGSAWSKKNGAAGNGFKTGKFIGTAGRGEPTQQHTERSSDGGRWPPNLLLTHHPDCRPIGVKRIKGSTSVNHNRNGSDVSNKILGKRRKDTRDATHSDADGCETVADWDCVDGCPVAELDRRTGDLRQAGNRGGGPGAGLGYKGGTASDRSMPAGKGDSGGPSRFFPVFAWEDDDFFPLFYAPKPRRRERNVNMVDDSGTEQVNTHATVKPIALMRWLVRLVTPPGGIGLDPFVGSGSSLLAWQAEGFRDCIGIDLDHDHLAIARARLDRKATMPVGPIATPIDRPTVRRRKRGDSMPLFGDDPS